MEKKKRGPKTGSKRRPPSAVSSLIYTILSAPESFALPEDARAIRDMLIDLASHARALSDKLSNVPAPSNQGRTVHEIGSLPCSGTSDAQASAEMITPRPLHVDMEALTTRIHGLYLDSSGVSKPNQVTLLQTALDIKDEMHGGSTGTIVLQKRPEFWNPVPWDEPDQEPPFIFPEEDLLQELVSAYFSQLHYVFPLFHRPTFERQVFEEKLHLRDRMFGATLLAVCANASRHLNDPRNLYHNSQSEHSTGWKYFSQVRFLRLTYLQPMTLFEVQLYALSITFLFPVTNQIGAWPWDMAQPCMELAQKTVSDIQQRCNGKLSYRDMVECELWKRAFWVILYFELVRAAITDQKMFLTPEQLAFDLPKECDDEYWFNESSSELWFLQPRGKPSYMAYWVFIVKYLVTIGHLRRRLTANGPEGMPSPERIAQIRMEILEEWFSSTPAHLRWDPRRADLIFFHQSILIQTTYCQVQIQILRQFLRPGPMHFSAVTTCAKAARTCLPILEVQHKRPDCLILPHLIHHLFMYGMVLLIDLWKKTWRDSMRFQREETEQVYKCLHYLSLYEPRYQVAGRLHDILRSMISASGVTLPSKQPSLKRSQSQVELVGLQDSYPAFNHHLDIHKPLPTESIFSAAEQFWDQRNITSTRIFDAGVSGVEFPGDVHDQASLAAQGARVFESRNEEDWASFMGVVDDMLRAVSSSERDAQFRN
ncbi:hypothetical protein GYMLUDRAFT_42960 [Collybiopsis luxurians FD-317 M1]|uniref:Xylanolytic transcriptional activator regulatory domain-containing protein n=1 Tax=Collybiopsis luxurians FD-317 M1 TaxID=944289 RepID=A0A0D0BZM3_9AGAR|nr:hypothetical protein GYMLUDRAFT_42960 [Collybiopsis luxurians FD-317 M1]